MKGLEDALDERLQQSRQWAEWAPGFKRALVVVLQRHLKALKIGKLSLDQWKTHLANDHVTMSPTDLSVGRAWSRQDGDECTGGSITHRLTRSQ